MNLMMTGAPEDTLRRALEAILATVWDAADWHAVIRDPALLTNEPLEPAQRADWERRLAAAGATANEGMSTR